MRTHRTRGALLPYLTALVLHFTAVVLAVAGTVDQLHPRWVRPKPVHTQWRQGWHENLVVLKFVEGSGVRLRDGLLVSLNETPLQALHQALQVNGEPQVRRLFSRPETVLDRERASGQLISGRALADLNLYYLLSSPPGADTELLVDDLNGLDVVELAYFEPLAIHGGISEEAWAGNAFPGSRDAASPPPDFSALQVYLDPAPLGVDARFAWERPGGTGQGVRIGVVERGANPNHEDLPWPASWVGGLQNLHHGTAVLGEIMGQHNGFGVMGIAPEAELHLSLFTTDPPFPVVADAIDVLGDVLAAGDILLLEYHAKGPDSGEDCFCSCYSFEYVPLEYWQATYDALAAMTANQVICVEIAGNGSMNLDNPLYQGAFQRGIRDSGAILVGAVEPGTGKPACWTNYGSRLDVHGHGSAIVTTGYGLLFNGGINSTYTDGFGGTSGAGAMSAGAVCAFQGWWKAKFGSPMMPCRLREYLKRMGSPQAPDLRRVGTMPDLRAAILGPVPILSARNPAEGR